MHACHHRVLELEWSAYNEQGLIVLEDALNLG